MDYTKSTPMIQAFHLQSEIMAILTLGVFSAAQSANDCFDSAFLLPERRVYVHDVD